MDRDAAGLSAETWREQERRRYRDNPDIRANQIQKAKAYQKSHPGHKRAADKRYRTKRYLNDPIYRLAHRVRARVRMALKRTVKRGSTFVLIGCSVQELKRHIESMFSNGMTWDNHGYGAGKWHLDHKIPVAAHDLSTLDGQKAAFHYTNLQPLWHEENQKKSSIHEGKTWARGKPVCS